MHNQINDIIRQLFKKNALEEVSDEELAAFTTQYPYVSLGHYLRAQKIYDRDPSVISGEQQTAALYIHNPLWLPWLLSKHYAGAAALSSANHALSYNSAREAYTGGIAEGTGTLPEETTAMNSLDNANGEPQYGSQPSGDTETPVAIQAPVDPEVALETPGSDEAEILHTTETPSDSPGFVDTDPSYSTDASSDTLNPDDTEAAYETQTSTDSPAFAGTEDSSDSHQGSDDAETSPDPQEPNDTEAAYETGTSFNAEEGVAGTEAVHETGTPSDAPIFADAEDYSDSQGPIDAEDAHKTDASSEVRDGAASTNASSDIQKEAPNTESPASIQEPTDEQAFPQSESPANVQEQSETTSSPGAAPPDQADQHKIEPATDPLPQDEGPHVAPAIPGNVEDDRPIVFQSYHTIDYFASQGIRLQPSDLAQDKLGQQLKSFTEWLKSMKKLSVATADPAKETDPEEASLRNRVASIAEHSLEDKEIITEAMAEVWAKQGAVQKAAAIYEKLSLQNPHKKTYFAAKIKQLNAS